MSKTSQAIVDVTAKRADSFLACAFELVCTNVPKPTDYAMVWAMKPDKLGATLTMTVGLFTASGWIGAFDDRDFDTVLGAIALSVAKQYVRSAEGKSKKL